VQTLFQAQSSEEDSLFEDVNIDHAQRFVCNNTVSDVLVAPNTLAPLAYQIPASLSRMLAGMLGWSQNAPEASIEYNVYQELSQIGWFTDPSVEDVQSLLSTFTIGGVAAMDANDGSSTATGLPRMIVSDGSQPIEAQILKVRWWWTGAFLIAIPSVHLVSLLFVIAFANKVIIKDDSPIAVAKIYHSLLNRVGDDHGCMLDGNQLIETLEKEHHVEKVLYGYQEGSNGLKHVDIFDSSSPVNSQRAFPTGDYDGSFDRKESRSSWKLDAHKYF
jgi:hypothetical protein